MACTSTRVWLRTTPAMAPATATGLEVAETFKISIAGRVVRGTPAAGLAESVFSPFEPFDGGFVSRVSIYSIEIGDRTFDWPPDTLTPSPGVVKRLLDAHLSIDPLHTSRPARKGIDLGQDRVELDHPFRHLEAVRDPGQEALQAGFLVHPDHRVSGAHHPQVGHEGRATRKQPGVGGGNMRVGAKDEAGPSVEIPTEGDLLRGRLGVDVHQHQLGSGALAQDLVRRLEGRIDRWHEELTLHIADEHLALFAQVVTEPASARRPGWVVVRAENRSTVVEAGHHLPLVPDVIPGGEHIDPESEEVIGDLRCQAETASRILAVGHHQVDAQLAAQLRHETRDRFTPGATDDIADRQYGDEHWRILTS